MLTRSLQERNKQYTITLPKLLVEMAGWKKHDVLKVMPDRKDLGTIKISKK